MAECVFQRMTSLIEHLTNDVRRLDNLDTFSAFLFQNNMLFIRKYCRKPDLSLQQFCSRFAEMRAHGTNNKRDVDSSIRVSMHNSGAACSHYRKVQFHP